jgi:hypothetical protein
MVEQTSTNAIPRIAYAVALTLICASAWRGGLRASLVPPVGSLRIDEPAPFVIFLFEGIGISAILEALRRNRAVLLRKVHALNEHRHALAVWEGRVREARAALKSSSTRRIAVEQGGREYAESALRQTERQLRHVQTMDAVHTNNTSIAPRIIGAAGQTSCSCAAAAKARWVHGSFWRNGASLSLALQAPHPS